jgi:hypothetical protein
VLVQETMHSSFVEKEKCMVIKIDMTNSFDCVLHSFLFQVLQRFGFSTNFIKWISSCIGGLWITPLVNGQLTIFPSKQRFVTRVSSLPCCVGHYNCLLIKQSSVT